MFILANVKVIKVCSVYTSRWLTVSHTYVFYNDYRKRKKTLIFRRKCVEVRQITKLIVSVSLHIYKYTQTDNTYMDKTPTGVFWKLKQIHMIYI